MSRNEIDNLNDTIAQALQQLKTEQGDKFSPDKVNLAELSRRTGISRKSSAMLRSTGSRFRYMETVAVRRTKPSSAALRNLLTISLARSDELQRHFQSSPGEWIPGRSHAGQGVYQEQQVSYPSKA